VDSDQKVVNKEVNFSGSVHPSRFASNTVDPTTRGGLVLD